MLQQRSLNSQDFQLIQTRQSQIAPPTLQGFEYKCQIINNILKTQLHQTFKSQSGSDYSETIYYFPTEENICLESFEARYQDKIIKGIVKEKEQAQKEYQENKNQGNFVSYASTQKDSDQEYVHIKLGNIPPNEQVEIILHFSQQLGSILNQYFIAQIPLLFVQHEVPVNLEKNVLTLDLFCSGRITYSESISSVAQKTLIDENTVRFSLNQGNLQQNLNLQIIFSFEGMFDPQVIFGSSKCYNEDKAKMSILPVSHSAMVTFIPNFNEDIINEIDDSIKAAIANGEDITSDEFQQRINIDLVDHLNNSRSEFLFLLDRSGSMEGQAIQRACEALKLFLKSLPSDSYFNVISFGCDMQKLFPESLRYTTDNLKQAIDMISQFKADLGGTEIYDPLAHIFRTEKIKGYNKQIFLLTDGEVDRPQEVIDLIKKNNKFNRVHSIGFGSAADQYLIKQSAIAGKGISKIVDFHNDLSEIIIQMLQSCITPTLDDFTILYDSSIIDSTHPSITDFPCVFKDEIINIHFFFKPLVDISALTSEQKKIQIEYFDSKKLKKVQKEIHLEMSDSFACNSELQESVFKVGKLLYLNENITPQHVKGDLIQQAVDFQLLTENTALICVIESLNDVQKVIFENTRSKIADEDQIYESDVDEDLSFLGEADDLSYNSYEKENNVAKVSMGKNKKQIRYQRMDKQNCFFQEIVEESVSKDQIEDIFQEQQEEDNKQIQVSCSKKKKYQFFEESAEESYGTEENDRLEENGRARQSEGLEESDEEEESDRQKKSDEEKEESCEADENNGAEYKEVERKDNLQQLFQFRKQKKQYPLKPNINFNNLLELVDSQGIWKYDKNLIEELGGLDAIVIEQFAQNFSEKDAFMTLFILVILELYFKEEKLKWVLISKKSLNSIKKYCSSNVSSLKESLLLEIQK